MGETMGLRLERKHRWEGGWVWWCEEGGGGLTILALGAGALAADVLDFARLDE